MSIIGPRSEIDIERDNTEYLKKGISEIQAFLSLPRNEWLWAIKTHNVYAASQYLNTKIIAFNPAGEIVERDILDGKEAYVKHIQMSEALRLVLGDPFTEEMGIKSKQFSKLLEELMLLLHRYKRLSHRRELVTAKIKDVIEGYESEAKDKDEVLDEIIQEELSVFRTIQENNWDRYYPIISEPFTKEKAEELQVFLTRLTRELSFPRK